MQKYGSVSSIYYFSRPTKTQSCVFFEKLLKGHLFFLSFSRTVENFNEPKQWFDGGSLHSQRNYNYFSLLGVAVFCMSRRDKFNSPSTETNDEFGIPSTLNNFEDTKHTRKWNTFKS